MNTPLTLKILRTTLRSVGYIFPKFVATWAANKFITPNKFPRPKKEEVILSKAQKQQLKNGTVLWTWGEGPHILLVHGWEGRGSQLWSFVQPLVESGFKVSAWDGPAHGDSAGSQTNLGEFSRFLVQCQKEIGEVHTVIAHSFGAAASVMASHFGMKTHKIILISSPCSAQDMFDRFSQTLSFTSKISTSFQKIIEEKANLSAAEAQVHIIGPKNLSNALIIHDINDKEIPYTDAVKISTHWRDAKLITTQNFGHRRILTAPLVIEEVLNFIKI